MTKRSDYRVSVKVRNNNILSVAESKGFTSIPKLAAASGISYIRLLDLVNMTLSPLSPKTGEVLAFVDRLCATLETPFESLFCDEQFIALKTNKAERELDAEDMRRLVGTMGATDAMEALEFDSAFKSINFDVLTDRESQVLRLRFGFDENEKTLDQVAEILDVTRERIRQIEAKALRKLRHPGVSGGAGDYFHSRY